MNIYYPRQPGTDRLRARWRRHQMGQTETEEDREQSLADSLRIGFQQALGQVFELGPSWAVDQWLSPDDDTTVSDKTSSSDEVVYLETPQPKTGVPASVWIVGGLIVAAGAFYLISRR